MSDLIQINYIQDTELPQGPCSAMAVLRMDLDGQTAPEPRPPSNSSDSSEGHGPSPDSQFDLADEVGVRAAADCDANKAHCAFWRLFGSSQSLLQAFGSDSFRMYDFKVRGETGVKGRLG